MGGHLLYGLSGHPHNSANYAFMVMGAVFGFIGFKTLQARKAYLKNLAKYKLNYPGQPWKWKTIWQNSVITNKPRSSVGGIIFGCCWLGAIVYLGMNKRAFGFTDKADFVLIAFFVVGLVTLAGSFYSFLRARKFGQSQFVLDNDFGEIGGTLKGKIVVAKMPSQQATHAECKLICSEQIESRDSKGRRSTRLQKKFHYDAQAELKYPFMHPGQVEIPVHF